MSAVRISLAELAIFSLDIAIDAGLRTQPGFDLTSYCLLQTRPFGKQI